MHRGWHSRRVGDGLFFVFRAVNAFVVLPLNLLILSAAQSCQGLAPFGSTIVAQVEWSPRTGITLEAPHNFIKETLSYSCTHPLSIPVEASKH